MRKGGGGKRGFLIMVTKSKEPKKETKKETKKATKTTKKTTKTTKKPKVVKKITKEDRIALEEKRLIKYLKNKAIDDDKLNIALDLIRDIAYMTVSTDILKAEVDNYGMTEEYQNGANQRGRKKSASFEAYLNMTKQKSALIKQLTDLLPADEYNPTDSPENEEEDVDPFEDFLKVRSNKNDTYYRVQQANRN